MITATYHYYVDWDGNNSFALPGEEISAFVFEASWEYGRDYASQLNGRSKAGSCRISLDNSDSRFSPFNLSSPIYGQMLPGRRVRIMMQIGDGSEKKNVEKRMWTPIKDANKVGVHVSSTFCPGNLGPRFSPADRGKLHILCRRLGGRGGCSHLFFPPGTDPFLDAGEIALFRNSCHAGPDGIEVYIHRAGPL